jgi:calcium-dependent protein kinase
MIAHHLNSPALAGIKEMFLNIDTDHTGTITRDNFRDVLRRGNAVALSDKELSQIFDCIDVAHDGEIHYSEFVAAMLQTRVDMTKDIVRECFDLFDVSRTGTISSSDLQRVLGAKGFEEANIETLLSQGHIDGTKRDITFEEFDDLLRDTSGCPKRSISKKSSGSLFNRVKSKSNVSDEKTKSPTAVNGSVSSLTGAATQL